MLFLYAIKHSCMQIESQLSERAHDLYNNSHFLHVYIIIYCNLLIEDRINLRSCSMMLGLMANPKGV